MNQNKILPLTMGVIILSLLIVIVIQAQQLPQWTHPTAQPPMGNIQMPISGWTDDETTVRLTTTTDNVGIGTATPAAGTRLDVAGRARMTEFQLGTTATPGHVLTTNAAGVGTWQAVGGGGVGVCRPPGFQYDTICSPTRLAGDTPCSIWRDCDGDTWTGGNRDCDEACPTCFVGSIANTATADGRDQNCNGIVDETQAILSNVGTGRSCTDTCILQGMTCLGIGTDASATNNIWSRCHCVEGGGPFGNIHCSLVATTGNCATIIGSCTDDFGYLTNEWTNCRCQGGVR